MKRPLDLPAARAIAADLCRARGVDLVYPEAGDLRREAILRALATVHAVGLGGWDLATARERVSVTMPAMGLPLAGLLAALPAVGPALAAVADSMSRTTIYLSPVACADPSTLSAVIAHELGHCDQIAAGGLAWCVLAYPLVPEVRGAAEANCYGQDVAVLHALHGGDPRVLCDGAMERLKGYGLDAEATALCRSALDVVARTLEHGGELGGPSHDVLEALRDRGVL